MDETAVNFHGCFFHRCRHHHPMDHEFNPLRRLTWNEIREDTERIDRKIRARPEVKHYVVKWNCEWDEVERRKTQITALLADRKLWARGDPRTALYGGRVEVYRLIKEMTEEGATIEHDDYQSLYPSVDLEGRYGKRHPKVYCANFPPLEEWFGIVYCTILPSGEQSTGTTR